MADESFLYCDEEVFIGKITDAEINKMESLGIETGNIPENRRSKSTGLKSATTGDKCNQQSGSIEGGSDIIKVNDLVDNDVGVLVISSDSDDSFIDTVSKPSTSDFVLFDEKRYAEAVGGLDDDNDSIWEKSTTSPPTPDRLNVVTDFGNQTPKTIEILNENRTFPLSPYRLNDLTQGKSTSSPPTPYGLNVVTDFGNQTPKTIEILNENRIFPLSPYRLNDSTQGKSTSSPPSPDRSNVVTDFGNQTPKTIKILNENRTFPLSPYQLNDLTQGKSTSSPPTPDRLNVVTDFGNQTPKTIEILNENRTFPLSPYRLNDSTQGKSTSSPPTPDRLNVVTDFGNQTPMTIEALNENTIFDAQHESPSDILKRSIAHSEASFISINAISDSVLNISHGSTIASPLYEDVTETDLHMSVDDTDYPSALGSDAHSLDRIPSASSYCTTAYAPQQASFETYRMTSESQIDLDDIKHSVIEKSFEASMSTSTSSCEKPLKHTFASKLPVWNCSGLIKPPKLVLPKTVNSGKETRMIHRPLKKATSIPSMLPKPKSTPVSKSPSQWTISSKTKLVPTQLQPKTLSSSKKNLRYGTIISPIRAYIQGTPVAMVQNGDRPATPTPSKRATPTPCKRATPTPSKRATPTPSKRATPTPTRQPGMPLKSVTKEVKPSLISKRPHFNKSSKEGQENVDPSRDTLLPRAFEHAAREEPKHPARRLPKVGADLKHMISPSLKITMPKGRLASIPRITVQSPSPLRPTNANS